MEYVGNYKNQEAKKMILNININIDTSNAAFRHRLLATEVQNILTKHLRENYLLPSIDKPLRDTNGNKVGTFTATLWNDKGITHAAEAQKHFECYATKCK